MPYPAFTDAHRQAYSDFSERWSSTEPEKVEAQKLFAPDDLCVLEEVDEGRGKWVVRVLHKPVIALGPPPSHNLELHSPAEIESTAIESTCPPGVTVDCSDRSIVLCFGDSLTEGCVSLEKPATLPYTAALQDQLLCELGDEAPLVVNAGERGETTALMLRRLPHLLQRYEGKIQAVLILGGTNDLGGFAWLTTENLLDLHKKVHAQGAFTGIMTIPDCTEGATLENPKPHQEFLDAVNDSLRIFAHQNSSCSFLVDVAKELPHCPDNSALWSLDRVHLSADGYKALGELVGKLWPSSDWLHRAADILHSRCPDLLSET